MIKLIVAVAALLADVIPVIVKVAGVGTSVVEVSLVGIPLICPVAALKFNPVLRVRLSGYGDTKNLLNVPARITGVKGVVLISFELISKVNVPVEP